MKIDFLLSVPCCPAHFLSSPRSLPANAFPPVFFAEVIKVTSEKSKKQTFMHSQPHKNMRFAHSMATAGGLTDEAGNNREWLST